MPSDHGKQTSGQEESSMPGCVHVIREECRCSSLGLSYPVPRLLVSDQWGYRGLYICWRLLVAMYHLGWSLYNWVTYPRETERPGTWFIYLTNWSFFLLTLSTVVQAVVVVCVHCRGVQFTDGQTRWYMKASWVLYEVSSVAALGGTLLWCLLFFDGAPSPISGVKHLGNSAYVILDLCVTAMPVRLLHIIFVVIYGVVYILFTVVYWAADGVNRHGDPYIYKPLDWNKAKVAAPLAIGTMAVGLPVVYFVFWLLNKTRTAVHKNCCCVKRQDVNSDTEMRETCADDMT